MGDVPRFLYKDVVVDLSDDVDAVDGLHPEPELVSSFMGCVAAFRAASGADVAYSLNPKKRRLLVTAVEPEAECGSQIPE